MVLGGRAEHRGAADVDVLDRVLEGHAGPRDRHLERIEIHGHEIDRLDARVRRWPSCGPARSRRASSAPWTAGCSVLTRPSSSSGKPVTSSTSDDGHARPRRSAAAVPPVETISQPSGHESLGEGDDPALVADRDQCARHDGRLTAGAPRLREGGPDARRPRRRARRPAAADARPRAPGRRGGPGRRRAAPATRAWARIGATIVHLIDEVHRRAALPGAAREHGLVHPPAVHALAAEGREQRGMDIEDAAAIALDHAGGHQLDVPGEHEQVDPVSRRAARATRRHRPGSRGRRSRRRAPRRRSSPPASARLLSTSTTRAGAPGPRACSSASRLLPRPETATAIRIVMGGKGNRPLVGWAAGTRSRSRCRSRRMRSTAAARSSTTGKAAAPGSLGLAMSFAGPHQHAAAGEGGRGLHVAQPVAHPPTPARSRLNRSAACR